VSAAAPTDNNNQLVGTLAKAGTFVFTMKAGTFVFTMKVTDGAGSQATSGSAHHPEEMSTAR
jgi:hypothetical protein